VHISTLLLKDIRIAASDSWYMPVDRLDTSHCQCFVHLPSEHYILSGNNECLYDAADASSSGEAKEPMEREHINPTGLYQHPAYTRVVTVTGPAKFIYIAGQCSTDADNNVIGLGDYVLQYRQIMNSLTLQLEAAGATWDDVVFKHQYTLDIAKFREAANDPENPRYGDPSWPPPSTLIGVAQLAQPSYLIEIEVVAAVEP
jgi:enamine deaminase RidA (YjgF/YER057c/UK114 family)